MKKKLTTIKSEDENSPEIADDNHQSEATSSKELIDIALEQLEPKFKSVVVLRLIDGYSTEETAKILNLPLGTVLSRLSRAQLKLKDILSSLTGDKNELR